MISYIYIFFGLIPEKKLAHFSKNLLTYTQTTFLLYILIV